MCTCWIKAVFLIAKHFRYNNILMETLSFYKMSLYLKQAKQKNPQKLPFTNLSYLQNKWIASAEPQFSGLFRLEPVFEEGELSLANPVH